jgi:hypothetical protein
VTDSILAKTSATDGRVSALEADRTMDNAKILDLAARVTALEQPVPPPPPPPPPPPTGAHEGRVQFCMYATSQADPYDLSPTPTASAKAWMVNHWQRMITYVPNIQTWHPGCWRYLDWLAIYVNSATANAHPEWILRDANNAKLTFYSSVQFLGDIGNPAYQDAMIAAAGQYLAGGAKGLHIDDVDLDRVVVPTAINPRTGGLYTLHDWDHDMSRGLQLLRAAYPTAQIVHNSLWWEDTTNPDVVAALKACDVFELERGFNDPNYTAAKIEQQLFPFIDLCHNLGTAVNHLSESTGGAQAAHFNLACALLCSNGRDYAYENTGWQPGMWDSLYDADLGDATGPRVQTATHVWERSFTHGHVKADLNTKTGTVTTA